LRVFLGFTNFYRRFVEGYSRVAAPLTELFRKEVPWTWGLAQETAFQELKSRLTSAPALMLPDFDKPFYVVCDASDFALGATLLQDQGNGLQPVAYEGRKMTPAETRYITTDKENLGLVHALRTWRCYLEGRKFTVETDHHSLKWLQTQPQLNRRQARWMELLASYDMDIIHKPGKLNRSDPLSRREYEEPSPDAMVLLCNVNLSDASFGDDFIERVKAAYNRKPMRDWDRNRSFRLVNGLWYTEGRLLIPDDDALKEEILRELHDAPAGGHFGVDKTVDSIARRFYWKNLRQDVQLYCSTCPVCQRAKHSNQLPAGLLQPLETPSHSWEQVTLDLLMNLPTTTSGCNAAVVFVDRLTKYFRWAPCNVTVTAEGVAKLYLNHVVRHHGVPRKLISDRDPRFIAGFWQELQRLLGTTLKLSTSDHPQTDGQTENANRTLLRLLRSYCDANPRNWDDLLCVAELAYNSHVHASTGMSPFYAQYGRHAVLPADLLPSQPVEKQSVEDIIRNIHKTLGDVKERLGHAQERQRAYANKRRRPVTYAVGDKVLVDSRLFRPKVPALAKLLPPYMGPFKVASVPGPVTVKLELPEQLRTVRVVHVSRVKPFKETLRFGDRGAQPVAMENVEQDPEWEVDALLARKKLWGAYYYLVHWKGYDHCEDCWICEHYLENAMDLVRAYDRRHPR
jgi:RNase H-like domain found in reverse transcriptase/Integrase zinc binding domain